MKPLPLRLRRFCSFIVGTVFFMSGIFKLMDPIGASLVVDEYYKFFHAGFLGFSSFAVASGLALMETAIGAALVSGVWRKVTAAAASALLGFFTVLTLILLIFNPPMDCGCFGEAIHLTHAQTFLKNIVLCALSLAAFLPYRDFGRNRRRKYVAFALVMTAVMTFAAYSALYIPLVDYTDFRLGSRLAAAEKYDLSSEEDMYEYRLIYEKDGKQETFSLEDLPDSTWTFVESEAVEKTGFRHEASPDLPLTDAFGEYCSSLAIDSRVMAVSAYSPEKLSRHRWKNIVSFLRSASEAGFRTLLVVSATPDGLAGILADSDIGADEAAFLSETAVYSDYKTLLSMNRSNGGVSYFTDGYLVRKWGSLNTPDSTEIAELAEDDETEILLGAGTAGSISFQGFLLYVFAVMLLL